MKKPAADRFANTTKHGVAIEGVRVNLRLDAKGKPLSVSAGHWIGDRTGERAAKLAIALVRTATVNAKGTADRKAGAKTSAKNRRKAAAEHWSCEWLEGAYQGEPSMGAERLAREARKQCALNRPDITAKKRDEISVYRAKELLRGKRLPK
jgi:hypothetical protein